MKPQLRKVQLSHLMGTYEPENLQVWVLLKLLKLKLISYNIQFTIVLLIIV